MAFTLEFKWYLKRNADLGCIMSSSAYIVLAKNLFVSQYAVSRVLPLIKELLKGRIPIV